MSPLYHLNLRLVCACTVLGGMLVAPSAARSDEGSLHLDRRHLAPAQGVKAQGQAQLSFGRLGEDHLLSLNVGTVIVHRRWRLAPVLPLRFRVIDASPSNHAVFRREDWDEPSDFARLLPLARFGVVGDPLYLHFGALQNLSLGHGTFVNRYGNRALGDHMQGGLYARGDWTHIGGELMIDDVFNPQTAFLRLFSRPFDTLKGIPRLLRGLRIGFTVGGDFVAPLATTPVQRSTGSWRLSATDTAALVMLGGDLEVPLYQSERVRLNGYLDVNGLDLRGLGVHAGAALEVRFSPLVRLRSRLEYRYASEGYRAGYVSALYEVQRLSLWGGLPKLRALRESIVGSSSHGFSLDTSVQVSGIFECSVAVADAEGPMNTDLMIKIAFPRLGDLHVTLLYAALAADSAAELFDPEKAVFAASARYHVGKYFFFAARLVNDWWVTEGPQGVGQLQTVLNYDMGIGVSLRL